MDERKVQAKDDLIAALWNALESGALTPEEILDLVDRELNGVIVL